ncbi:MAG TPA: glycosyltransferase [Pirellulales bacterium]|nr:glycosyltransferase [Pirellulales bacterium]
MTRRILYIVSDLQPSGTTSQLKLLAAGLAREKFELHVAALNCGGHATADLQSTGIDVAVIGRRWLLDPLAFSRLRKHIDRLQPDLVQTWQFHANAYGRAAALAAGVKGIIATERTVDTWKVDFQWAIDRRLTRRTQRIIANSVAVKNACVAHGLPAEKFTLIPNAADAPPPCALSRSDLLAELGLPAEAKLIAFVGRLEKQKRIKELIWATDQLKAVGVPAHLLIIGQGPLQNRLERYARLNQIDSRVHFLGVRDDVPCLLQHVDVLWQAGDREGHSSAVLEAMAAGVPVVAADAAGNRELVVPAETGFLVPLTERAGFARATLPLLENLVLAQRLGETAQRRVQQFHAAPQLLAAYTKVYEEL